MTALITVIFLTRLSYYENFKASHRDITDIIIVIMADKRYKKNLWRVSLFSLQIFGREVISYLTASLYFARRFHVMYKIITLNQLLSFSFYSIKNVFNSKDIMILMSVL